MAKWKLIIYSLILGLLLSSIGAYIMGYVSTIAVPKEFYELLGEEVGYVVNGIVTTFVAYGLLAILVGMVLGRISHSNWLIGSITCLVAFHIYFTYGKAFIYDTEIIWPYSDISLLLVPQTLVIPICLFLSTYMSSRKYNQQLLLTTKKTQQ